MSFLSYLINGISLGSVYAIIALGYTMVYGIAKMLNFAHGDVIMIGAYVVFTAMTGFNVNPIVSVIIAMVVCTVLGIVIERVAYKPLRNASSNLAVLITAIGVSYLLQNVALLVFGGYQILQQRGTAAAAGAGRGSADDPGNHHRNDCGEHRDHDRPDAVRQPEQAGSGHAGRF